MNPIVCGTIFSFGIFLGMLVCLEIGRRIGNRRLAQDPEGARHGVGAVEGAVFGLMGLLIAFTFSGAAERFNGRRHLVVEEANDIGTAWLRLDLVPPSAASGLREQFRQYLDSRIETYRQLPDVAAAQLELARSLRLQGEIWTSAVAACRDTNTTTASMLLLPALNTMFDITTTRTEATKHHPPVVIFVMLGGLSLAAALMAGCGLAGSKSRHWLHVVGFAAITAIIVYVIIDMEYPRLGFIRVDAADSVLIELRASMNP